MSDRTARWENLVGRAEQQKALLSFLERGARGGAALAVSGQPGVGRSALVDATVQAAASIGYVVLTGSAVELEAGTAFATLNQILVPVHDVVAGLDHLDRVVLTGALGYGPQTGAEPAEVAEATVAALARVDPGAPVLIAVDDVQWADPSSAAVLAGLARAATGRRLAVLVAHRAHEPVPLDLSAFEALEVPPLDPGSAATLLSERSPDLAASVRVRVLTEAQGNPLALSELPTGLTARQRRGQEQIAGLPLTARLRAMFGPHMRGVDAQVRRLLLTAALDDRGSVSVLAAALGRTVTDIASGDEMAAAVRSGLARIEGDGEHAPRVVFGHPLVRATVVETSSRQDRQRAHRTLAVANADRPERRAYHLGEAVSGPDAMVADLLADTAFSSLRAGNAVAALNALVCAAELSPVDRDRRRRLAQAAYLGTDVTGDLTLVSTLLAEMRTNQPAATSALEETVAAAQVLLVRDGDADTAHRLLVAAVRAWSSADGVDTRLLLGALSTLFEVCIYSSRPEFWPPLRAAAAELGAIMPTELRLLFEVLADPARTTPRALAELDTAVARLDTGDERDPIAIERIATAALFVDRVGGCEPAVRRLAGVSRSTGAITCTINAAMVLWAEDYHRGRWDSCAPLIEDALALCTQHGLSLFATPLRYGQALLAAARGDDVQAERLAAQISAWAAPRGLRGMQCLAWHARGLSAIGRGDFAEAHRLFGLIGPTGVVPQNLPSALWMIYDVVEAAVRSGHRDQAVAQVEALLDMGVADISPRLALVVHGAAALSAPPAQAGALFETALATPGAGSWPFDRARVRLAYGEHLRRQRKIMLARAELGAARRELRALCAAPWVARADVELRAAQAPADRHRVLTPQQQEISALAAAGLTNKQIAQRLQLSPRTVGAHLRQVFPKLGISSRGGLHDAMRQPHLSFDRGSARPRSSVARA